jgi:ATPase subunit of ABC transporter with duplicated ATPase domains
MNKPDNGAVSIPQTLGDFAGALMFVTHDEVFAKAMEPDCFFEVG